MRGEGGGVALGEVKGVCMVVQYVGVVGARRRSVVGLMFVYPSFDFLGLGGYFPRSDFLLGCSCVSVLLAWVVVCVVVLHVVGGLCCLLAGWAGCDVWNWYIDLVLDGSGPTMMTSSGSTMLTHVVALVSVALVLGARIWAAQLWTRTWWEERWR